MRRMVTSKQIEALNKIKVNDDEVVITSVDDEPIAEFYYEEGGAGESVTVGEVHIDNTEATPQIYGDGGILQIGDINSTGAGAWVFFNNGSVEIGADNRIVISGLPNSDPHANGALWNDNGTLKISSGN